MELIQRPHPCRVSFCKIVIYRYHMYPSSGKCIEVNRKSSYQGFPFSCCHFSNFTTMKHRPSYKLHIVMHHIPHYARSCSIPAVLPNCLVSLYFHEIFCCCQLSVSVRCLYYNLPVLCPSSGSFLYQCKGFWLYFV